VPNLKTDRVLGVALENAALNVRRLMYQSLIWAMHLGDQPGGLRAPVDTKNVQGAANPLVHGVRRNAKLDRDFLGGEMLVDEQQGIELASTKPGYPRCSGRIGPVGGRNARTAFIATVC
jgi:hypothetical protein